MAVEIQIIAAVVAVACAIPGVFLVLRRMSLMSDAISHAILLGIVLAFFIVKDLASPLLVIGAAATGIVMVALVELFANTRLVSKDASVGLVFPAMFSIGVILISRYAGNVHLDVDAVLLGELAFAAFDRFVVMGVDLGPRSLWVMVPVLVMNLLFMVLFYKELKISTFDPGLAATFGFMPFLIHYSLMALTSITAVGAFDAVGSVLVVALMIVPALGAYILTERLLPMIGISILIALVSSISGYWISLLLDVSIAGSMATMTGVLFVIIFLVAPKRGIVAIIRRKIKQRWEFAQDMLMVHLLNHKDTPEAVEECNLDTIHHHFNWKPDFAQKVILKAMKNRKVFKQVVLSLSDEGVDKAKKVMMR
jgi:manganese/zinc/iron transport system permease protein